MPLSDTAIVQVNSGSLTASGNVTLASGTTAGNTVIVVVGAGAGSVTSLAGFTNVASTGAGTSRIYQFVKSNVSAGESSWLLTFGTAVVVAWRAYEIEGLDPVAPVDVKSPYTTATGTSVSTGTTGALTTYDGMVIAAHSAYNAAGTTPATWSGHTNGFVEEGGQGAASATASVGLSVSFKYTQALAAQDTTATASASLPLVATAVVYSAAGAKREANIVFFWGMKVGAGAAGLNTGNSGSKYFETVAGTPVMTADGLQLTGSASIQNVAELGYSLTGSLRAVVARVRFRLDSLSGDLVVVPTNTGLGTLVLRYVSASQQLGLAVPGGSEALSDQTVTTGVWYSVDMRITTNGSTMAGSWQVDDGSGPVVQADPGSVATVSQMTLLTPQLGWTASSTGTVTYAYALYSVVAGHHPLGPHEVMLLGPDLAATPTVSGTVGSFAFITSNATGAALTAPTLVNVPATIDDFPPTVGASADGFCVATASASDYLEVPLATYDASGTGSIRAARVVIPVWAASATACTCKVQAYDGTTRVTLFAEADPGADNTSTPAWICKMWRPTGGWDQAKLDAAAVDYGSADATPDNGPLAVGMEVAVQGATTAPHFGDLASSARDPLTAGITAISVTPTSGYDATLHYEEGGTPTDVATLGGTTTVEVIDAPDAPAVNYVALYPPAEDTPDA